MVPGVWRRSLGSKTSAIRLQVCWTSLGLGGRHPLCLRLGSEISLLMKYRCKNEPFAAYAGKWVQAGAQGPGIDWAPFLYTPPSLTLFMPLSITVQRVVYLFFCPTQPYSLKNWVLLKATSTKSRRCTYIYLHFSCFTVFFTLSLI